MSGSHSHAARPIDLVALVTFDDEVRENQAITLERLGHGEQGARTLNAALSQWLHLGRRMWVNVEGREVRGIATARDLEDRSAWIIDTLIDASGPGQSDEVITDLLTQAAEAALKSGATHLLLRTAGDAAAREPAMRAGFRPALPERLWTGVLPSMEADPSVTVRAATTVDELALFQLYSRSAPAEARALLAMTRDEWNALRERRWFRGGTELVAEMEGRAAASLAFCSAGERVQFTLTAEPGGEIAVRALLAELHASAGDVPALTVVPRHAGAVEAVLAEAGFAAGEEFVLQSRRLTRPVEAESPVPVGVPIPSGGGA